VSASCPAPAPSALLGAGLHLNQLSRFPGPPHYVARELAARGVLTSQGREKQHGINVLKMMRRAEGKVPRYPSVYALRHFAASLFIEQGFSPKRVQVIMGHKKITTTYDTYGHLFPSPEDDWKKLAAAELSVFEHRDKV
jgi:integrase